MATPQEIQAWLAANPGATDRDIAAAMNQYGVSAADLSGATGWDQGAITDRYGVANAQNYIDTQWSDPLMQLPGNQDQRNWGILGATNQMGLTDDQQARVLGWSPDAVSSYEQQYNPQVGMAQSIYQKDLTSPAPYMQPMQPTSNAASTLGITQPQAPQMPAANQTSTPGTVPFQLRTSNDQIRQWLAANPNATDSQIKTAMDLNGVGIGQLAGVTGMNRSDVQSRYNAATSSAPPIAGGRASPGYMGSGQIGQIDEGTGGGPISGPNPYLSGGGFTQNPYYTQMADDIGRRTQQGLGEAFNQIRSHAVGVGGLGGSRQGVAEGVATGRAMDSMQGQLGGLFGGLYESGQNRDLQRYNIEGNQNLANQGQWMNFYTGQRGQDLQSIGLGADLYSRGIGGEWAPIQNAGAAYAPFTGFGTSTTSGQQGGGLLGAVGGGLAGGSFGRQMNWW